MFLGRISNPSTTLRASLSITLCLLLPACATNPTSAPVPNAIASPSPSALATFAPVSSTGTLTGHVTIGPLSPVQRVGVTPPPIPPEVYAARTIQIFAADGATLVTNVKINPEGTYTVTLPSGNYVVNIARSGIDRARGLPKTITIANGKIVQLDIDIDTGIR